MSSGSKAKAKGGQKVVASASQWRSFYFHSFLRVSLLLRTGIDTSVWYLLPRYRIGCTCAGVCVHCTSLSCRLPTCSLLSFGLILYILSPYFTPPPLTMHFCRPHILYPFILIISLHSLFFHSSFFVWFFLPLFFVNGITISLLAAHHTGVDMVK
mmetsp:Transcript_34888/g.90387  ORF Transcript_34888/g.90387 Transcript_34888/m.90387 type:complete len:155 (-) Transcript_34888:531-995(-)